jgi:hypothetical protein
MQRDSDRISITSKAAQNWKSERLHLLIYLHILNDIIFLYREEAIAIV